MGQISGHYLIVGVVYHGWLPLALVVGVVNHRPLPFSTAWGGLAGGVRDLRRLPLTVHILIPTESREREITDKLQIQKWLGEKKKERNEKETR